jgi:hypothetical protein
LSWIPYRVPHHPPASDPSVGPTLLRFRHPSTASPGRAPCGEGFRPPHPGSARRFSQPLGGFMADPSLRPCFMPLPSLGYLSLQSLTSQRSRTRLRAACSLAVIPAYLRALSRPFHHGFHRRPPHPWGSCRYPPAAMDHLSARPPWLARVPVTTGPRAASSRPTTRIIRFEASFPLQSCAAGSRESPRGSSRALLGVPPLQSLLHPFLGPSS